MRSAGASKLITRQLCGSMGRLIERNLVTQTSEKLQSLGSSRENEVYSAPETFLGDRYNGMTRERQRKQSERRRSVARPRGRRRSEQGRDAADRSSMRLCNSANSFRETSTTSNISRLRNANDLLHSLPRVGDVVNLRASERLQMR